MSVILQKRASETWRKLPQVGGSRWGFIGVIAGVALVVILIITVAICCCCRKGKKNKRMKHAAQGSDLSALHPAPLSFGRAHQPKFAPVRNSDHNDDDAFLASSPRNSFSGGYAYPSVPTPTSYNHNKHGSSAGASAGNMRMNEMSNAYSYDSELANPYTRAYQPTPAQGGYADPYAVGLHDNAHFVEPQYVEDHASYYPNHANMTTALSSSNTGYTGTPPPPQQPRSPFVVQQYAGSSQSPYHSPQPSQYLPPQSPEQPSGYPQSFAAPSLANGPPPSYITYDAQGRSYDTAAVSSPPRKHRATGGAEV